MDGTAGGDDGRGVVIAEDALSFRVWPRPAEDKGWFLIEDALDLPPRDGRFAVVAGEAATSWMLMVQSVSSEEQSG